MMKPVFFSGVFFSVVSLLSFTACRKHADVPTETTFTMTDTMMNLCRFYTVEEEEVWNEVRLFGKISADNNKTAQVYSVVGGVVAGIHVELGDYVKQGQVLATIQSSEVAQFQKEKMDAVNNVAMAEKNLQVARDLFAGKLNSEKDVTLAEKELEKARAELVRMNEIYSIYSLKNGSYYSITAPISGFVLSKKISQNELIRSDMSEPLFSIAETDEVLALANVNEMDIPKVSIGQRADVKTLAFPDDVYTGKIDKIFNVIDPETKSMKVLVKLPNPDFRLKPEMNCTVSVIYGEDSRMPVVPSSSIIFDKSRYWVMVFKSRSQIETRQVTVYRQMGNVTYVSSGLQQGETVISENGLLMYDAIND